MSAFYTVNRQIIAKQSLTTAGCCSIVSKRGTAGPDEPADQHLRSRYGYASDVRTYTSNASWICRFGIDVLVTRPKVPVPNVPPGFEN